MAEPTIPPPPPPPSDRPPVVLAPLPGKGPPPWGKIVLFGCLVLFLLGIAAGVVGFLVYRRIKERDETLETFLEEIEERRGPRVEEQPIGTGGGGVVPSGGRQLHTGTLGPGDPLREDGTYYEEWTFEATVGSSVVVILESDDFDAYVSVFSPSGDMTNDDDSGGETDAKLDLSIDETGTWRVWANAYKRGESGDYRLTIERR